MSRSHKRYLVVRADGAILASNASFEGAAHTASVMAGPDKIGVLDGRSMVLLARFGGVS